MLLITFKFFFFAARLLHVEDYELALSAEIDVLTFRGTGRETALQAKELSV